MKAIICDRLKAIELCLGVDSTLKSTIDIEDGTVLVACSKTNGETGYDLADRSFYYNSSLFFPDCISSDFLIGLISVRKITGSGLMDNPNVFNYEILDYRSFTDLITLKEQDYKIIKTSNFSNPEEEVGFVAEFLASVPAETEKLTYRLPVIKNGRLNVFVGSTVLRNLKKFHNDYTDKYCISFVCSRKDMINYISDDGLRCKIPFDIIICRSEHDKDSLSFKIDSCTLDGADLEGSFFTEIEDGYWMFVLHEKGIIYL